jgi:uncharacterized membrane protein
MEKISSLMPVKNRLKFIDAARSIAILLMLEGHFITLTLDKSSLNTNNTIYSIWYFVKGFTAPMFFSVSGIIFVYQLSRTKEKGFFRIVRIKKGFRRSIELLFWGYMLQVNILNFNQYISLEINSWFFAFHVLQCIGTGIVITLLIFGLYKLINYGKLYIYYLISGTVLFLLYSLLKDLPEDTYFPNETYELFQNMFHGPYSIFPIIPWVGFVLYGGAIGSLISDYNEHIKSKWASALFILTGLLLQNGTWPVLNVIDLIFDTSFVLINGLMGRFGQVLIVVGILMRLEKYFKRSNSLFLKIGQNTLPIYVIHVMVLYSGFFGLGLNNVLKEKLTPLESIFGAVCFIAFFVVLINYYHYAEAAWSKFKKKIYEVIVSFRKEGTV